MPRAKIEPGQHGDVKLTGEVQDDSGNWVKLTGSGKAGRFRASARVRDLGDGQVRQVTRFAPTKTRARALLEAELKRRSERQKGAPEGAQVSVQDACAAWLVSQIGHLAVSTTETYSGALHKHLVDQPVGLMPVGEVRPSTVNTLLASHTPATGKIIRSVLRGTFDQMVDRGHLESNPVKAARSIRQPRKLRPAEGERDSRRALTRAEREHLMAFADSDRFAVDHDLGDLVAFLAGTGCRVGEALALRWDRVKLPRKGQCAALIDSTITRETGAGLSVQEGTKTAQDRTVVLPEWLSDRLRARKARRPENSWNVVFDTNGHLRDRSNTTKLLRRVYDGAGFPWMVGSHTLRRTAATLLDDAGLPIREVANQLGHARPSMTLDVYLDRRQTSDRAASVL